MAKAPTGKSHQEDERSRAETERIREATLKTLLNTPPKPHAEMIKERHKVGAKRGTQKDKS